MGTDLFSCRRSEYVRRNENRAWFGGFTLALPREVYDGRGVKDRPSEGTRAARRSCVRLTRYLRWEGRERQESSKMARSFRVPGYLHGAIGQQREGASGPHYAARWQHRDQ